MTKPSKRAEVNNFVKGLVTEASPLNFPPNASLDEENFELNRDGSRDRRFGIGFEDLFVRIESGVSESAAANSKFSTFRWLGVGGSTTEDLLVVQSGQGLKFFDLNSDSLSNAGVVGEITIGLFPDNKTYSFTSLEGVLVVAAGTGDIAIISKDLGVFSLQYDRLLVRDLWGVEVVDIPSYESDDTYRGDFSIRHLYNLQNQSWGIPRKSSIGDLVDPTAHYRSWYSKEPSNSELVWAGLQYQPVTSGVTFERIYLNLYEEVRGSSVKAAKGYYVIDLLRRGPSRTSEFASNKIKYPQLYFNDVVLPSDTTQGGASVISEFAGRVWYGGFSGEVIDKDERSPDLSNFVAFSQLIRNKSDFKKCYQDGDPTSRDATDLVDTDGGYIRISGAKNILALVNMDSSLVVVASNGVWQIVGGADYGFSATNYKVTKISSYGGLASSSVVVEGSRLFFWSEDGIYGVARNQVGDMVVESITESTIQTLYNEISDSSKIDASGVYDSVGKKVRWLYKEGVRFSDTSLTYELILDTVLNAFTRNKISKLDSNSVEIVSLFKASPFTTSDLIEDVYAGTDAVYADTEPVQIGDTLRGQSIKSIRYLTLEKKDGLVYYVFSLFKDVTFTDWVDVDGVGVDAKAYVITGQQTIGDAAIAKQMPYLLMYFQRTENGVDSLLVPRSQSGCMMRCQWDFSDSAISNKWSTLVQTYRYRRALTVTSVDDPYDNGFSVVTSKSKVRGRGKAFSLYLETESQKDCRILGWSIVLNGNSNA